MSTEQFRNIMQSDRIVVRENSLELPQSEVSKAVLGITPTSPNTESLLGLQSFSILHTSSERGLTDFIEQQGITRLPVKMAEVNNNPQNNVVHKSAREVSDNDLN